MTRGINSEQFAKLDVGLERLLQGVSEHDPGLTTEQVVSLLLGWRSTIDTRLRLLGAGLPGRPLEETCTNCGTDCGCTYCGMRALTLDGPCPACERDRVRNPR